jgi:CelD/BcsL family acetyltransferase involved in cellulose biosynthesis
LINGHLDRETMQALGFRGEPVVTYRVALFPDDQARALKTLKESARRNVRRGIRLGLVPRFEESDAFVDEMYDQTREVFARGGNSVPFSKTRMLELFRRLRDAGTLAAISVSLPDGTGPIATGIFTIESRELMLWQWAHRTAHRWYRPTELMTWTVMQRAMAAGCDTFDLMGGGEFKARFGAQREYPHWRWIRSRHRWIAVARDVAAACYSWQHAIRGRLRQQCLGRDELTDGRAEPEGDE